MRLFILPYKMGSEGAKALSKALNIRRLYTDSRSKYKYRTGDIIINWGLSVIPSLRPSRLSRMASLPLIINKPEAVTLASNKLLAFNKFKEYDVPTCEFGTSWQWVQEQFATGCFTVYARKLVQASCGRGIVICTPDLGSNSVVSAPLYTKYYEAKREYRVHVVKGEVIDYVKKGKRRDRESDPDHLIRNHSGGWVFIRDGIELPEEVKDAALKAVASLGLDFGAVDIGYNKNLEQKACVYEVNTAMGMSEGSITVQKYSEAFTRLWC